MSSQLKAQTVAKGLLPDVPLYRRYLEAKQKLCVQTATTRQHIEWAWRTKRTKTLYYLIYKKKFT